MVKFVNTILASLILNSPTFHIHVHNYTALYNTYFVLLLLPECGDIRVRIVFCLLLNISFSADNEFLQDAALPTSFFFTVSLTVNRIFMLSKF